jgi:hypothetical protein
MNDALTIKDLFLSVMQKMHDDDTDSVIVTLGIDEHQFAFQITFVDPAAEPSRAPMDDT